MGWLDTARARSQVRVGWRTNVEPSWEFDLDALALAARTLGLRLPIEVGCAEYPRGRWGGMHSCERRGTSYVHRVRVRRASSANSASRLLWHELAHAAQSERLGTDAFDREYEREERRVGYERNPFEIEAREHEPRAYDHPLVRPHVRMDGTLVNPTTEEVIACL